MAKKAAKTKSAAGRARSSTKGSKAAKKPRKVGDLDGDGKRGMGDAKVALTSAGKKGKKAASAVAEKARDVGRASKTAAKKSGRAAKGLLIVVGDKTFRIRQRTRKASSTVRTKLSRGAIVVGTTLLDLNNDGKIDEQDLRIVTAAATRLAKQGLMNSLRRTL